MQNVCSDVRKQLFGLMTQGKLLSTTSKNRVILGPPVTVHRGRNRLPLDPDMTAMVGVFWPVNKQCTWKWTACGGLHKSVYSDIVTKIQIIYIQCPEPAHTTIQRTIWGSHAPRFRDNGKELRRPDPPYFQRYLKDPIDTDDLDVEYETSDSSFTSTDSNASSDG